MEKRVNSLPHGKSLDLSKLRTFADDNFKVAQMVQVCCDRIENIVGKGENAGNNHFSIPTMFSKGFFPRVFKSRHCVVKG